jgi:hypothetical protein
MGIKCYILGAGTLSGFVLHCITSKKTVILMITAVKVLTLKTKNELPKHLMTHISIGTKDGISHC